MGKEEDIKLLRDFKQRLFQLYWEKLGVFYIHVLPHPNLEIGRRGLVDKEREAGIVLVFGTSSVKGLVQRIDHLAVDLQFGATWEKLLIPWDAIFRIYDKGQLAVTQLKVFNDKINIDPVIDKKAIKIDTESKVIQVDFGKKV